MRAVMVYELGDPPRAELTVAADPVPGDREVLVEVHAAPVNYVDLVTMSGGYQFTPALPYTPGKGPAGIVRATGSQVRGVRAGDRVLAMAEYGGYAELVCADQEQVYRLPDSIGFVDAAAMSLAFDTAWVALRERARLASGDSVLVLGATGAVGGAAVQLARAMGASPVIAGVSSAFQASTITDLGADALIDLSLPNQHERIREEVFAITGGSGVDVVVDPLGGDSFDAAIRAIAWRGRLVVVGFAAGRIPTIKANYLLLKNIEISGLQISDYRKRMPQLLRTAFEEIFELCAAGAIHPPPASTMPLDEWHSATTAVRSRARRGRVVLLPRGDG